MAATQEKATVSCTDAKSVSPDQPSLLRKAAGILQDLAVPSSDPAEDQRRNLAAMATLIRPVASLPEPSTHASTKGVIS